MSGEIVADPVGDIGVAGATIVAGGAVMFGSIALLAASPAFLAVKALVSAAKERQEEERAQTQQRQNELAELGASIRRRYEELENAYVKPDRFALMGNSPEAAMRRLADIQAIEALRPANLTEFRTQTAALEKILDEADSILPKGTGIALRGQLDRMKSSPEADMSGLENFKACVMGTILAGREEASRRERTRRLVVERLRRTLESLREAVESGVSSEANKAVHNLMLEIGALDPDDEAFPGAVRQLEGSIEDFRTRFGLLDPCLAARVHLQARLNKLWVDKGYKSLAIPASARESNNQAGHLLGRWRTPANNVITARLTRSGRMIMRMAGSDRSAWRRGNPAWLAFQADEAGFCQSGKEVLQTVRAEGFTFGDISQYFIQQEQLEMIHFESAVEDWGHEQNHSVRGRGQQAREAQL